MIRCFFNKHARLVFIHMEIVGGPIDLGMM